MATALITATTRTERIIFKCRECKHVWAYDYTLYRIFRSIKSEDHIYRLNDAGEPVYESEDIRGGCPACKSRYIAANRVNGIKNDDHKCDARCLNATGKSCECSCGGANHGLNHLC